MPSRRGGGRRKGIARPPWSCERGRRSLLARDDEPHLLRRCRPVGRRL